MPTPIYNELNSIDRLTYSTDAITQISSTLTHARYDYASVNSATRGYVAGGIHQGQGNSIIERLDYNTETTSVDAESLMIERYDLTGVNSTTKGYFVGGVLYTDDMATECDIYNFSTSTITGISLFLENNPRRSACGTNSLTKGYLASGSETLYGAPQDTIISIVFSNDTTQTLSSTLYYIRGNAAGFQSGGIL